jgi:hypothetical protein
MYERHFATERELGDGGGAADPSEERHPTRATCKFLDNARAHTGRTVQGCSSKN